MTQMEAGDAADVEDARSGDPEAFRRLVDRHSRAVYRLAHRMTGNAQDAEEVVQETFLKVYRRIEQFESRSQFGSWLHRIAANCALDVLRSRARRAELPMAAPGDDESGPAAFEPASEAPSADRVVFGDQVERRLRAAMARLSPLERAAFVLRHYEGLSIVEVGAALGLETSAAKQGIFRAVRKLREALEPLVRVES